MPICPWAGNRGTMLLQIAFALLGTTLVAVGIAEILAAPSIVDAQLEAGVTGPDDVPLDRETRIKLVRAFGLVFVAAGVAVFVVGVL